MIEIKNLNKKYNKQEVLKSVNLKIEDGQIFGIVGRSGEGKSTILKCINGLEAYDSGSIKVDGIEVKDYSEKSMRSYKKNMGMIFQQFPLMSRKTVYDNIAIPLKCWGYKKNYIKQRVCELAKIVDIEEKLNLRPDVLSGGQKQRVAIARALSLNPKFLLCDEATSALDPKTTKSILRLLEKVNEKLGITVVVVTHQMSVVKSICEQVAILEKGTIVSQGLVQDIFYNEPQALKELVGDDDKIAVPDTGINIKISYDTNKIEEDILCSIGYKLNIPFTVVWTNMDIYKQGKIISFIINISDKNKNIVTEFLSEKAVNVKVIENEL